jgi:galactose mutarotase-like enzyme
VSDQKGDWVSLASSGLSAQVDPLGAQLSSLQDGNGRDLLWNGDPSVWSGRAPLLFPIVGALAGGTYRLGSHSYPLSRHGFARGRRFDILEVTVNTAVLRLRSDAASFELYPFQFNLDVRFEVNESVLSITSHIRNLGAASMPASFGYHPAFRWPLPFGNPRASHFIEFELDEPAPIRRLNAAGLLTPTRIATPISARRLSLADELFVDDVIIWDEIRSRHVTYGADQGPRIRVAFKDAAYLGIWSKPGANFICIEPWRGIADPEGFAGDFTVKPGVFTVDPGAAAQVTMEIALLES